MRFKKRPRASVVTIAATASVCFASTVLSYHHGYLEGTRETIENSSTVPSIPDHFTPMPSQDPVEIQFATIAFPS